MRKPQPSLEEHLRFLHMLAGSSLPVEMFFPSNEYPSSSLEGALAELGVTCRRLPDLQALQKATSAISKSLSGFTLKIAALILSQYAEVSTPSLA